MTLFYKTQILIWHYFAKPKYWFDTILQSPYIILATISQSSNANLTLFYKDQILIWQYFTKPKYYFGKYFIKPKCYFGTYLQNSNIILTLVLHILNPPLMGNIITHLSRNTSLVLHILNLDTYQLYSLSYQFIRFIW